jgi:hypothetical protein
MNGIKLRPFWDMHRNQDSHGGRSKMAYQPR